MSHTPVEKKPIKDLLAEKDAFLTTSDKIYEYFLRHTKGFIIGAVAIAALIFAWAAYDRYEVSAEETATAAYEDALETMAEAPDQAAEALEAVRADFAGRKASRMAAYALVGIYSAQSENSQALAIAEELLRTLPPAEAALKPALLGDLAGLYEAEKKYDLASATYESILDMGIAQPHLRRDTLMSLGRVNAVRGNKEEAIGNYQALINEFPGDMKAYMANSILAALTAQPQAFPGSVPAEPAAKEAPAEQSGAAAAEEAAPPEEAAPAGSEKAE
jgi:predicted negative regulator of RcsB-dependent stress response